MCEQMVDAEPVLLQQSRNKLFAVLLRLLVIVGIVLTHDALNRNRLAVAIAGAVRRVPARQIERQVLPSTISINIEVNADGLHVSVDGSTGVLFCHCRARRNLDSVSVVDRHADNISELGCRHRNFVRVVLGQQIFADIDAAESVCAVGFQKCHLTHPFCSYHTC